MRTLLTTLWLLVPALGAQAPEQALARLLATDSLADARIGVHVVDLDRGGELLAHDADKGFMTASNMKLVSSATALRTLGPDHRFVTRVVAAGRLEDGVLDGDLLLVGSGDPTLGGRQEESALAVFERMAATLVDEHGLREVRGRVVGVDDVHADEIMGKGWQWDYQSSGYAAQISGLCFAENAAEVVVAGGEVGGRPQITIVPEVGYMVVANSARTVAGDAEADLDVHRRRATNTVVVTGTVAAGDSVAETVSVENPCRFAAAGLRAVLHRRGIAVGPAVDGDDVTMPEDRPRRVLAEHRSAPLREILVTLNKVSQNLYAEQLLRAAGAAGGHGGDRRGGAAQAAQVLGALGVDTDGLVVADGSGLTRRNLVRPRQLSGLLAGMWRSPDREVFTGSLPVAGVDGTLKSRFPDGPAHGRVRAKTGYISRVVALSGYVPRSGDRAPLVFSVLINNFTCRTAEAKAAVDRFVQALAARADQNSKPSPRK